MKYPCLIITFFIVVLFSCKKNNAPDHEQPVDPSKAEISLEVINKSSGVEYQGRLKNIDTITIKQVGFVWSRMVDPEIGKSGTASYIYQPVALGYSYELGSGLIKDSVYYARAFFVDKNNSVHYSSQKKFTVGNVRQLQVTANSNYTWGDEAQLMLDPLNVNSINNIAIIINDRLTIHPTRVDATNIYFKVPNELGSESSRLYVQIYDQKSNIIYFHLKQPAIIATSAGFLSLGETLTIDGKYFHPDPARNSVTIGASTLNIITASNTQLTVKAENLSISESGKLVVKTGENLETSSNADYKLYRFLKPEKDFPGVARTGGVTLEINKILYFGMGISKETNAGLSDWWKYDPQTGVWTKLADYPSKSNMLSSFVVGGKAYVGMGYQDGYPTNAFYAYDPAINSWQAIASFRGAFTRMPCAFNSVKFGYLIGGEQKINNTLVRIKDSWRYDPGTNGWSRITDFPGIGREYASTFTINNQAYVIGGGVESFNPFGSDVWAFDLQNEQWKQVADLPGNIGKIGNFAFSIQNKGYLGGGTITDSQGVSSLVYEYDPAANTWTLKERIMDDIRYGAGAIGIGNTAYIVCGAPYFSLYNIGSKSFFTFKL